MVHWQIVALAHEFKTVLFPLLPIDADRTIFF